MKTTEMIRNVKNDPHLSNSTFLIYAERMAELLERAALIIKNNEHLAPNPLWLEDFEEFQKGKK